MEEKELEPLLKALVTWAKKIAARQDAVELILLDKKVMSEQEWKKALQESRQRIPQTSQSEIKKVADVAKIFEALSKH